MDFDLWGPYYDQAPQEDGYFQQSEWHCRYYFDSRSDIIEEEALNDKYCRQVLQSLNSEADSEIDELEKDLASLQRELAWFEHQEWPELRCDTLKEKIDSLGLSIKSLKNKSEKNVDVSDQMSKEPPQKSHELLSALHESVIQQKEKQVSVTAKDTISDALDQVAVLQAESTDSSGIQSDLTTKEETKELGFLTVDKSSAVKSSLESQKEKATDQSVAIASSSLSSDTLKHAHQREESIRKSDSDSEILSEERGHSFIPSPSELKVAANGHGHSSGACREKEISISSDVTVAESFSSLQTAVLSLESIMKPADRGPVPSEKGLGKSFDREDVRDSIALKKDGIDSKVTASNKTVSSADRENSCLLHVDEVKESCLSCPEEPALKPVLRLQDQMKDAKKPQANRSVKQSCDVSLGASRDVRSDLKSSSHLPRLNKRKTQTNISKPCSLSADANLGCPYISEANKKLKYEPGNCNVSSNKFLDGKVPVKSESSDIYMPEMYAGASSREETLAFLFPKGKRKSNGEPFSSETKSSAVRLGIPNLHEDMSNAASKANSLLTSSCSIKLDHAGVVCPEPSGQLRSINSHLTKLKLIDLKAIAKEQGLKSYSKLGKKELIQMLTDVMDSRQIDRRAV